MIFVSVTRLHLRSWRYFPAFFWHADRSARAARRTQGNLHASLTRDSGGAYWTLTLWTDRFAMLEFMMNGPHRTVMPRLQEWCDEAALVHWHQETPEVPSWREAHQRLQKDGRTSKLKHPSAAHTRFEITPSFS